MDLPSLKAELAARGELRLNVKVVPKSSRSEVSGIQPGGVLKIRVQAPPEKGKANSEVRALLAKHFGLPLRQVEILRGESSSLKQVRLSSG